MEARNYRKIICIILLCFDWLSVFRWICFPPFLKLGTTFVLLQPSGTSLVLPFQEFSKRTKPSANSFDSHGWNSFGDNNLNLFKEKRYLSILLPCISNFSFSYLSRHSQCPSGTHKVFVVVERNKGGVFLVLLVSILLSLPIYYFFSPHPQIIIFSKFWHHLNNLFYFYNQNYKISLSLLHTHIHKCTHTHTNQWNYFFLALESH